MSMCTMSMSSTVVNHPMLKDNILAKDFLVGRNEKVWICAQANVVNQKKGNRHLNLFVRAWLLPVAGMGPLM